MTLKNITQDFFTFLFIFFSIIPLCNANNSFILLKIDNQIITNTDVENEKKYLLAINEKLLTLKDTEIFSISKESIIRERVKINELEKYFDIGVPTKFLDDLVRDLYSKLGYKNLEDLNTYLVSKNLDIKTIEAKLNIEALWNELIFLKYNDKVEVDEKKLKNKIKNTNYQNDKELVSISEIVFSATTKAEVSETHDKILNSIKDIGFNNTANIYSVSNTAKFGGDVGWVGTNQLTDTIFNEIKNLKIGEYSGLIIIPGGFLILKINDKKVEKIKMDPEEQLKKLIIYEKDKQFNEFSSIYFQKIKKNALIDEK